MISCLRTHFAITTYFASSNLVNRCYFIAVAVAVMKLVLSTQLRNMMQHLFENKSCVYIGSGAVCCLWPPYVIGQAIYIFIL